jgi:hypothetical protein
LRENREGSNAGGSNSRANAIIIKLTNRAIRDIVPLMQMSLITPAAVVARFAFSLFLRKGTAKTASSAAVTAAAEKSAIQDICGKWQVAR